MLCYWFKKKKKKLAYVLSQALSSCYVILFIVHPTNYECALDFSCNKRKISLTPPVCIPKVPKTQVQKTPSTNKHTTFVYWNSHKYCHTYMIVFNHNMVKYLLHSFPVLTLHVKFPKKTCISFPIQIYALYISWWNLYWLFQDDHHVFHIPLVHPAFTRFSFLK